MTPGHQRWVPVAVLGTGVGVALLVGALTGEPLGDTVTLIVLALGGAAAAVAVVWLVTRIRPGNGIGARAGAVALVSVGATTVGVVVGARAMFISEHDLVALGVIVATATGAGLAVAWSLGTRIEDGVARITELSRALARGERPAAAESGIAQFDRLGRDMVTMADRLEESHRRELALEASRRELVTWVSHDLRSPLAGIRAMAEALEDGVVSDPEESRRYLRAIGEETERLARLVDDLNELSRVTSGSIPLDARPVGVADLLVAVARGAQPLAEGAGVGLHLPGDAVASALPEVHVSEAGTVRVLRNLMDNAIRHTPAGGTVTVRAAPSPRGVRLSVADECGGIPAEDLERVFDVAFRGDAARRRDSGGGGLGLAIAKGLAEAQHGSLTVANRGAGCCFTLELPTAEVPTAERPAARPGAAPAGT